MNPFGMSPAHSLAVRNNANPKRKKKMKVTTSQFHYYAAEKEFVVEASNLGRNQPQFHQVYPDSCDEGLTLVSAKTGKEVDYAVNHTEKDREGDIAYWELTPTRESLRKVPQARGTTVTILND